MGNYKFKFSNMIPNAWFHKLKNINNTTETLNHSKQKRSSQHSPEFTNSNHRKSYYFSRDLALVQPISPSNPATAAHRHRHRHRPTPPCQFSTSVPDGCSCIATTADDSSECTNSGPYQSSLSELDSVLTEYGSDRERDPLLFLIQPGTTGAATQNCTTEDPHHSDRDPGKCGPAKDIVTDTGKINDQCRQLPPIITRKTEPSASPVRRLPLAGIKLRVNSSPRLAVHGRRRSMAVVKASKDPRRDFRESMVEMISQYNIRESNDLEELLACYLLLNSDDHHHLIINVFKQIWSDFIHLRLDYC